MLKFFENVVIGVRGDTVYLAPDSGSGYWYKFKNKDELKQIVVYYFADLIDYDCEEYKEYQDERKITTKEKIALINRMMDHLSDLSCQGKLSDDELQYLCNEFRHLRQYLTKLHLLELQEGDENEN